MNTIALNKGSLSKYLRNCFILLVPILVWNIAFYDLLPPAFHREQFNEGIPSFIIWTENILRLVVFVAPAFMPLTIFFKYQKFGLALYFIGIFIYFLSWRPLILYPDGDWSTSLLGFMLPAITPMIFLTGIGLIGYRLFFNVRYKQMIYILISFVFVLFYAIHMYLTYQRIH